MPTPADAIIPVYRDEGEARRHAADAFARLAQSPRPRLLLVTHGRRGGVARHVEELAALLSPHADALVLRPHLRSFVALEGTGAHGAARLWFHRDDEWADLSGLLRELGIARVHFHHVQGMPARVLDLGRDIGCPWDVTVHDYYPLCPQYQLTDATGRYCGEPDEAGCTRCLAANPPQWPMGIVAWRDTFGRLLSGASRVIAPSQDTARRIARHFPSVESLVWPHAEFRRKARAMRKILVLGGLSPAKGMALVEACARDARDRDLALRFRVVGHVAWPVDAGGGLPVTFTGEYPEGALDSLVEQERADAIFFPAQWPETYSYTLSAALDSGLPILATDLGAFRERLEGCERARVLPWNEDAGRFNDALLALTEDPAQAVGDRLWGQAPEPVPRACPQPGQEGGEAGLYRSRYLEGIVARAPASPAPRVAPPGRALAPEETVPKATLVELFDDGVRCGNGRSLAELGERIANADRDVAQAGDLRSRLASAEAQLRGALSRASGNESSLAVLREQAAGLAAVAKAAEERAARLEASTSWRLTAPLRRLVRFLRR